MSRPFPGRMTRIFIAAAIVLTWSAPRGSPAHAQDARVDALVEQIAGTNIYLRVGTDNGVSTEDTLTVLNEAGDQVIGGLYVISATASRSVVSYLSDPFPLTRGTLLHLRIGYRASEEERAPGPGRQVIGTQETLPQTYPSVSGRLALQFNTLGSTTSWVSNEEVSVSRRFSTPTVGLRLRVRDLPGGVEFNSNLRGSYRYTSNDLVDPAHSVRVYQASFRKSFENVPLQVQLGRFYNRYETYSGYWDGLLLRFGNDGIGAGVVAGFEPGRSNEGLSTDIPKYAAFVDFSRRGDRVGYFTDVSFHQQMPSDNVPNQMSVGWSQHLIVGQTRIGADLQVHRDPENHSWSVTRLHTNGAIPLANRVVLLGRFAFDRPEFRFRTSQLFSFERQQASVGFRYWERGGNASLLLTTNRVNQGDLSYSLSSSFNVTRTRVLELGFHGSGTIWLMEDTRVFRVLAGIDRVFGRVQSRASYQFYRTVGVNSTFQTHTVDAGLLLPVGSRIYSSINARITQGSNQTSNSIFVGLWTSF